MIRVLLLLGDDDGSGPDFQTARAVECLRRAAGAGLRIETRAIGRRGDWGSMPSAVVGVRQLLRAASTAGDNFDLVHAWGVDALTAAAFGGAGRVVFSPTRFLRGRALGWLRAVMGYRDVQVVCPTATQRRVCVERGVPPDRCHLIRPGVDFARLRGRTQSSYPGQPPGGGRRDAPLRAALGLTPDDYVLLAPGESTPAAAHEQAAWAGSILHVMDERYKVLLWGRGERATRAAGLGAKLRQPDLVRSAEARLGRAVEFEEILPAADAALVAARGPVSTLPVATCMAAGLPIVAAVTYTVSELLEDRHSALMVPPGMPRLLARRVLDLREDPQLQWSIRDIARTEAYEYFALTRFVEQWRSLYRQAAAGEKVDVPEPAPGAGRRFHGRG